MMDVDFGKDFNQREYWKYDIQVKMGILKVLQEIRDGKQGTADFSEQPVDYHSEIARQLKG
jgi:hypothetical protein